MMHDEYDEAFWDERYRSSDQIWSGNPNVQLVAEVSSLAPGRALDAGCGEGADAVWLAERGWQVTALDISAVALQRAAARAAQAGTAIARRIEWLHADLLHWSPDPGTYDLVSAHYMHLPAGFRESLFRGLAAAVAPGGELLIVGHHPDGLQHTTHDPSMAERLFTAEEIAASLDGEHWEIAVCATRPRPRTDSEGRPASIDDAVVLARRRGPVPVPAA